MIALLALACAGSPTELDERPPTTARPDTRVVLLGTGTPLADPTRSGPAVAVIAGDRPYLVDMGPGVVRRAQAAFDLRGEPLEPRLLDRVFVTHLHSDHTAGLPDLLLSPWVLGRETPLSIHGPVGTAAMAEHVRAAWSADRHVRVMGLERLAPGGSQVEVQEITAPGEIYADANVTVEAIAVPHGSWDHAWGYRFQTTDRRIVVSGDTATSKEIAAACDGCDVLVHEVFSAAGMGRVSDPGFRAYHGTFHTSTRQLAALAKAARPKLLVLYHQLYMGVSDEDLVDEIESLWDGTVVSGSDLDVY